MTSSNAVYDCGILTSVFVCCHLMRPTAQHGNINTKVDIYSQRNTRLHFPQFQGLWNDKRSIMLMTKHHPSMG